MMKWMIHPLLAALLALSATAQAASFYKWKDANGQWHFADQKPPGISAQQGHVETTPAAELTTGGATQSTEATPAAARQRVVMYSAAWCGYCKKARAFLRDNRVAFSEYDVETSAKGKRDYQRYGAGGVPIILVGKQRIQGFDPAALTRLLDL